ncbi:MAG: hypothetical protein GY765_34265 [bacterium]|nr:hypothetical protein [bacterium]
MKIKGKMKFMLTCLVLVCCLVSFNLQGMPPKDVTETVEAEGAGLTRDKGHFARTFF